MKKIDDFDAINRNNRLCHDDFASRAFDAFMGIIVVIVLAMAVGVIGLTTYHHFF